ncbi:hypothetical protein QCA50_020533 [Cerrena zonata]|uniref:Uncharacterized protein n=1 Tax=Cerrena zonata TaxID=2478898 RepID=A0AAW0F7M9_9APHY
MSKDLMFPSLSVRAHQGFNAMFLCPFFEGYRDPYFLDCTLSGRKDIAVQELSLIRRFIEKYHPPCLTIYVKHNLRPEVLTLLQHRTLRTLRLCSPLGFRPGYRKHPKQHMGIGLWDHVVNFNASSPCLFTPVGKRFLCAIACGQSIQELHLSNHSMSPLAWAALLPQIIAPKLRVFEVDGRVSLKCLGAFLVNHIDIHTLKIGNICIPTRLGKAITLPALTDLHAPVSAALPLLRGSRNINTLELLMDAFAHPKHFREALRCLSELPVVDLSLDFTAELVGILNEPNVPGYLQSITNISLYLNSVAFSDSMLTAVHDCFVGSPALTILNIAEFFKTPGEPHPILLKCGRFSNDVIIQIEHTWSENGNGFRSHC